jgi:hypothetical protein
MSSTWLFLKSLAMRIGSWLKSLAIRIGFWLKSLPIRIGSWLKFLVRHAWSSLKFLIRHAWSLLKFLFEIVVFLVEIVVLLLRDIWDLIWIPGWYRNSGAFEFFKILIVFCLCIAFIGLVFWIYINAHPYYHNSWVLNNDYYSRRIKYELDYDFLKGVQKSLQYGTRRSWDDD